MVKLNSPHNVGGFYFFSGFVTMATVEGGGDLVGFYQQCPATQKLQELKLHSWGNEKKKEPAWYSY